MDQNKPPSIYQTFLGQTWKLLKNADFVKIMLMKKVGMNSKKIFVKNPNFWWKFGQNLINVVGDNKAVVAYTTSQNK